MTYKRPGIIRPKLKKVARTWELVIAIAIFLFLLYRVALLYEWIPVEYQPSTVAQREYAVFKEFLRENMHATDASGKAAKWTYGVLSDIEAYLEKRRKEAELHESAIGKCQENAIFRFFMQWGEEKTDECSESNLQLKQADEEIRGVNKKQRQQQKQLQQQQQQEQSIQPQSTQPQPTQTQQ